MVFILFYVLGFLLKNCDVIGQVKNMSKVILISGGARSGKSSFAEEIAKEKENVLYIATSIPFDDEMKGRIKLHKDRRPDSWSTIETYKEFEKLEEFNEFQTSSCVLLDCLTLMTTNTLFDNIGVNQEYKDGVIDEGIAKKTEEDIMRNIDHLVDMCRKSDKDIIFVTNEVGLGIVPENKMTRYFRDISGRVNMMTASLSDEVYMVFMGIPNKIK